MKFHKSAEANASDPRQKMKLFSAFLVFALSVVVAGQDADPGIVGWNEQCGSILGTQPCSNPALKCCYLYPDYGVCRLFCPKST
ncbi:hypothetical protein GALMADRAFT_1192277 [Galerina marginata CBS 339.88]|uniref:CBM1 domain-containing protein n=1 Tax=Galerina marginata (strain CBS 339.88) TaxID=685588 RepID=A0A067TB19_GALM3|nr:hypothetical protein GALMADRAFT_1192277 [Galerina marginata CBS 339.88]